MSKKRSVRGGNNATQSLPGPSKEGASTPDTSEMSETSEEESNNQASSTTNMRSAPSLPKKTKQAKKPTRDPLTPNRKKFHEAKINALKYDCAYYMLVMDIKKYPVKRSELIKNVLKGHKQEFKTIILGAKSVLEETFGIKLVELGDKKGFILVIADKNCRVTEFNGKDSLFRGLLLFILTVIWMKEGSLPEQDLWDALKVFNVDPDDAKPHPEFGDVRKYVTQELPKQMYLVYQKVNTDPPMFEFEWGPRATYEVDKEVMLDFVCEVHKTEPKDWIVQHQKVREEKRKQEEMQKQQESERKTRRQNANVQQRQTRSQHAFGL